MKTEYQRRDPKIRQYFPIWWHHHGTKMRIDSFSVEQQLLTIAGNAASVKISRNVTVMSRGWFVEWEIRYARNEKVNGRVFFTSDDLRAAFDLSRESGDYGDWLIEQFGADSASQGKFIRWKDFLNIPCPGTGHDGDPNVSIYIDEEIQAAVRQLVERQFGIYVPMLESVRNAD